MSANCIDVSSYQGTIDWAKVYSSGVRYCILRSVIKGLGTDTKFEINYKNARAAGLKVGVYVYAYATTTSYAKSEANALVKLLNGRELDLPVFYDMESSTLRSASKTTVQNIADAFRTVVKAAGYDCHLYMDKDFYSSSSRFKDYDSTCDFWIASYGANDGTQHTVPSISHHLCAHQFSSKAKISGVGSTYCDVSNWYGLSATSTDTATTTATTETATTTASTSATNVRATEGAASFKSSLAGTYKVTANKLNVRYGAGTKYDVMTVITKNTKVKNYGYYTTVSGTKWLYIQFTQDNIQYTGFASSAYLSK